MALTTVAPPVQIGYPNPPPNPPPPGFPLPGAGVFYVWGIFNKTIFDQNKLEFKNAQLSIGSPLIQGTALPTPPSGDATPAGWMNFGYMFSGVPIGTPFSVAVNYGPVGDNDTTHWASASVNNLVCVNTFSIRLGAGR
jgi:hypothetical protein